jgi:hypothetical protein
VFVGSPFRAAILLPQKVGTFAKMLAQSAMPVFVGSPFQAATLLPQKVSTLANDFIQALLGSGQDVPIIPIRNGRSTPTDMHSSGQILRIGIGYQLRMGD